MIEFVNAKINIGLNIVGKREDGYHLLETIFYPVGLHAGTPRNTDAFSDVLEITQGHTGVSRADYSSNGIRFHFNGRKIDCPPEKNLIVRAAETYMASLTERTGISNAEGLLGDIRLEIFKNLPDGAGMGGGSADASFVLRMLNGIAYEKGLEVLDDNALEQMAAGLGADCPVFIRNRPAAAWGIGEKLEILPEFLKGMWIVVVKPDLHISTKEAFTGVVAEEPAERLRDLITLPISEWRGRIENDFEKTLFPRFAELGHLKSRLYDLGADYASLTGSGAALYGIFATELGASECLRAIAAPYKVKLLL